MNPDHPFTTTVPVQYRDLDPVGHANHAAYVNYFEEARLAYFRDVLGIDLDRADHVVASLGLDFRKRVEYGDSVAVEVRIPEIGRTSLTTVYELRVDGSVAATGSVVLVTYDREAGEPRPIPQGWRQGIQDFEGLES